MHDALFVRRLQGFRDLSADRNRVVDRDGTASDPLREVLALDHFHDQGRRGAMLLQAVDLRDVRVIQSGEGLGLALEPHQAVGIGGDRLGQHFERDVTFESQIARAIDLAHPAFAKLRDDFIGPEFRAYLHRATLASARPRRSSRVAADSRAEAGPPSPSFARIS